MQVRTSIPIQRLALVIGLGLAAVAGLLCWTGQRASTVQASQHLSEAVSPTSFGATAAGWTSTHPVTTILTTSGLVWDLGDYPVVITFPEGCVRATALITFTPKTSSDPPPPGRWSYLFDLRGVISGTTEKWGLEKDYTIALRYDPSALNGALEQSLRIYHYYDLFGKERWEPETTSVDMDKQIVYCTTGEQELFVLSGYSDQVFLPFVQRNH